MGAPVINPTAYRSLAGALQNLTVTRPDISYTVRYVCLHMDDPHEPHVTAAKRTLRYLRGILDHDTLLHHGSTSKLVVYTDADWAACLDTCRSTLSYVVFLGDNFIFYSSKH
jgi:hypothetical protein